MNVSECKQEHPAASAVLTKADVKVDDTMAQCDHCDPDSAEGAVKNWHSCMHRADESENDSDRRDSLLGERRTEADDERTGQTVQ